jgi:ORF6N domain-containing protein
LCPTLRRFAAEGFNANRPSESGMTTNKDAALVPVDHIAQSILVLRGHRVLLDSELAALYGATTKRFNEQVKRNLARFPADFMFQLTPEDLAGLRSHFATSKPSRGGRRYAPYAFTEHGAIMAAMILNSRRAVEMSVYVVRAFVQLRELLTSNKELAKRLDELEARVARQLTTHDQAITGIIRTIRELMNPPELKRRPIGFTANLDEQPMDSDLTRTTPSDDDAPAQ